MLKDDCSIQVYQPAGYGFLDHLHVFVIDTVLPSAANVHEKRPYGHSDL